MTKCDVGSLEVHHTYKFVYIKNAEGIEAKRVYPHRKDIDGVGGHTL